MKLRKILSTVLVLSLIAAMVPFRASADDWDDWDDEEECEEHDFSVIKTEPPTCEDEGYSYHVCSKCGEDMGDMFDFVEPLGHVWGEWEIEDEPTCEDNGCESRYCQCEDCDAYEERSIDSLGGHIWAFVKVVPPTCEDYGYDLYACTRDGCDAEEERNYVEELGGEHEWVKSEVVDPTCTEDGYTVYVCSVCGDTDHDDYTEPLGHSYKDGHCIRCGAPDPADSCIAVEQYSLTLDSDIAVNFKVMVPATLIDKATPVFTFDGQKSTVEFGEPITGTTDRYIISYHIVPKRMGSEVWLEMQDGSGKRITLVDQDGDPFYNKICKYSVINYCEMAHKDLDDDNLLNLVDALQDYGYYAQKYFGTYEDIDEPISDISAVKKSDLDGYSVTKTGADLGISEKAMSLVLESKTKIRHRFELAEGHSIDEFTFTCGGKTLTPVGSGSSYSVTIEDIAGQDLDKDMTITVTSSAASGEYVVTGSALAYCKLALEKKSDDTALCDLIKAMYLYNQAANAYCAGSGN